MTPKNILRQIEKAYPVIESISEPLRDAIVRDGFAISASSGQIAFEIGDPCASFLFILSGRIRVIKAVGLEREILLYNVRPGESCILTVSGILGNQCYPARGIWDESCMAFGINAALFQQLVAESFSFRTFIFHEFSSRITHLMELVDAIVWKPVNSRLAGLLLAKADGVIRISHQSLANELGTVREVVSRALEDFERQGLIKLARMSITLQNHEGLKQIAQPRII